MSGIPVSVMSSQTCFLLFAAFGDGCADGQRDGLFGIPDIALCRGTWSGSKNLRTAPSKTRRTYSVCGNQISNYSRFYCPSPADVCADGWHVCGSTGHAADIFDKVGGVLHCLFLRVAIV